MGVYMLLFVAGPHAGKLRAVDDRQSHVRVAELLLERGNLGDISADEFSTPPQPTDVKEHTYRREIFGYQAGSRATPIYHHVMVHDSVQDVMAELIRGYLNPPDERSDG